MPDELLTLRQAARLLQVSEKRLYQLDDVLSPVVIQRGTKMKTRYYSRPAIEREMVARCSRASSGHATSDDLDRAAAQHAARWLRMIADHPDVGFDDLDADQVRRRIRKIADRVERGRA